MPSLSETGHPEELLTMNLWSQLLAPSPETWGGLAGTMGVLASGKPFNSGKLVMDLKCGPTATGPDALALV